MMAMNKIAYQTPSVKVLMLCQQVTLLAGSAGVQATRGGYDTETDTWE